MPATRRHHLHIARQPQDIPEVPDLEGVGGTISVTASAAATGSLLLPSGAPGATSVSAPPLAANPITLTTTPSDTPSATSLAPSSTQSVAPQSASSSSALSVGTVVAACVGAFVGAGLLICLLLWWCRRPAGQKSRARSGTLNARNAQGEIDQRRARGRSWNQLGDEEDRWEGMSGTSKHESQQDIDEKNFGMFKKTNSMRTTRTARALEEHGFDLPPLEFSKYHPQLAEELAQPEKPFVTRQNSAAISWDGETVGDDSFLSLRSVRVDSGAMSPTLNMAKMTPPAVSSVIHKWESAEVITVEEPVAKAQNPFTDAAEERRKSGANPFFGAQDIKRTPSRGRSRSNSRSSRHSRNTSRATTRSRAVSESHPDPFTDDALAGIPNFKGHLHTESTGSNLGSEHAMKSLIAALNLTQEEVEERLRVASFHPSISTRYSGTSVITDDQDDAVTIRGFPAPPTH
ncbi:unnamed protein product [Somion occarium]|uniref:Uncharacterized protein n=1 Tax=Somion occarium TaxID=3059160 RepID=A0ABP1E8A8_9APHY